MTLEKRTDAGLLRNILSNTGGNVLAITAAATLPMLGVIGGAVDISRIYLVKSRVQAACDSAVLAGRKAMTTLAYTDAARARARSMFNVNFQDSDYDTSGTNFTTTASADGVVSGTATTTVPMVLMNIFGAAPSNVSVTCSADIQIPNIDIVFVLDVTGSMDQCPDGNCNNNPSGEVKKIVSLKLAVKDFYTTLANAMAGNTVSQVRFGFVPYSQAVNGKDLFKATPDTNRGELPLTELIGTMEVQSRTANFNTLTTRWIPDPNSTPTIYTQRFANGTDATKKPFETSTPTGTTIRNDDCTRYGDNQSFQINSSSTNVTLHPSSSYPGEGSGTSVLYRSHSAAPNTTQNTEPTSGTFYTKIEFRRTGFTGSSGNSSTGTCTREVIHTRYIKEEGYRFTNWNYKPVQYGVTQFRAGTALSYVTAIDSAASTAQLRPAQTLDVDPVTMRGWANQTGLTSASTTWDGCIEERTTTAAATFDPIPAAAFDLDVLTGGTNDARRWRPILRELTYDRAQVANRNNTTTEYSKPDYTCPSARMRNLNEMTQTEFNTYVDGLNPGGYTYLDVGMVWGLRLISAQGMFASRNLTGPNGGQISRHIIFLTDGEPVSQLNTYSAYGVERMAGRITGGSTNPDAATRHARRFQALCDLQRGGVSIWAIALGTSVTGNMSACADPGRAYEANNTTQLRDAFRSIAQEVADLRLVQ